MVKITGQYCKKRPLFRQTSTFNLPFSGALWHLTCWHAWNPKVSKIVDHERTLFCNSAVRNSGATVVTISLELLSGLLREWIASCSSSTRTSSTSPTSSAAASRRWRGTRTRSGSCSTRPTWSTTRSWCVSTGLWCGVWARLVKVSCQSLLTTCN